MYSRRVEREDAVNYIEDNVEDISEAAREAGEKLREVYSATTDELVEAVNKVERQIRNTPIQASLIAIAAGFIVGMILSR